MIILQWVTSSPRCQIVDGIYYTDSLNCYSSRSVISVERTLPDARQWVILLSQKDLEYWFVFFLRFSSIPHGGGGRHFFRWLYASGFPFALAIRQIDDGHSENP